MSNKIYRSCVGMMIINNQKEILVGKRIDHPSGYWQMPQGGIDENENPEEAVWREMMEEIGTNKAKLIRVSNQWINYDIPADTLKKLPWGHKYKGQTQKWYIMRFLGNDNEINLKTKRPEFFEWKWINIENITDKVVDFKLHVYEKIKQELKNLI